MFVLTRLCCLLTQLTCVDPSLKFTVYHGRLVKRKWLALKAKLLIGRNYIREAYFISLWFLVVFQLPGAPDVLPPLWLGGCSTQCQGQEATEVSYRGEMGPQIDSERHK